MNFTCSSHVSESDALFVKFSNYKLTGDTTSTVACSSLSMLAFSIYPVLLEGFLFVPPFVLFKVVNDRV